MRNFERSINSSEGINKLISLNFILITVSGFIFFFNFHSFLLLPLRIELLGGNSATIGFIMGAASLSTLVSTPSVGFLADRFGKKFFLVLGGLLLAITTLPFAYINEINFLYYVLRVLHGAAFSFFFVSAGALTADIVPKSRRTQAVGLYGVFTIINYAIAPYVGKVLIDLFGFSVFFKVVAFVGVLVLPLSLLITEQVCESDEINSYEKLGFLDVLFSNKIYITALTLFLSGVAFVASITFLPVFSSSLGIKSFHLFFIAYTVSTLSIRIFFGWIPDRYGKKLISIPSLALFALSMFVLSITSDVNGLVFSGVMFGIAHGFAYPSLYSLIIDNTSDFARAKAFALCSFSFTSGGMFGTFLAGVIANVSGYRVMYSFLALVVLVGFFVFSFFAKEAKIYEK